MKSIGLLFIGAIALLSTLAIACGSDGDSETPADGGGAAGIVPAVGMIMPGQYMTFEGQRYELVNLLFEDMVSEEFEAIGEVAQSDVDVDVKGDTRVFRRAGDTNSLYTFVDKTDTDPAYWLAWNPVS